MQQNFPRILLERIGQLTQPVSRVIFVGVAYKRSCALLIHVSLG